MFKRKIAEILEGYKRSYRAIALIGPRQSGKTTLARHVFPVWRYLSLENPENRLRAIDDPKGLLRSIEGNAIFDEIQNVPTLLSYLQEVLDDPKDTRKFIVTGSNSFQLNEKISQSLAGRIRILTILPFLRSEIPKRYQPSTLEETLWTGSYPRIFDEKLNPLEWNLDYHRFSRKQFTLIEANLDPSNSQKSV